MIPLRHITAWALHAPWPTDDQVEQDLLLSRLIIEISNHPHLGDELVFRGGTCLHKLYVRPGLRYSEDLDYVRRTTGGIGQILDALRSIGQRLGMKVGVDVSKYPKVKLQALHESGVRPMRIKIEVNTYERSPARPLVRLPYSVDSSWFSGSADVQTFGAAELVATKLRALYQRSKGRDLYDLWLALVRLGVPPHDILAGFAPYRPDHYSGALAIANLEGKTRTTKFVDDLVPLVRTWPDDYDIESAAALVIEQLLSRID